MSWVDELKRQIEIRRTDPDPFVCRAPYYFVVSMDCHPSLLPKLWGLIGKVNDRELAGMPPRWVMFSGYNEPPWWPLFKFDVKLSKPWDDELPSADIIGTISEAMASLPVSVDRERCIGDAFTQSVATSTDPAIRRIKLPKLR